ncbi:ERF118 protein [Hibiscus syriacus]|uniref:ERF118 protein n=1 Tax=Hibiscus syriacus TaxID=106335 RepID=A0A6A2WNG0_HIBSY|nr:ERF118 protein [Hibiscus syriacus]
MVNWSLRKAPPRLFLVNDLGSRKKKSGGKDGKDECGKVYECREASEVVMMMGFLPMNRERETETLNRARQLVFNNDNLTTQGHLGCNRTLPFRSVYPPRMFPGSSSTLIPPPPQLYLHPYPTTHSINDYYVGHVLGSKGSSQYPQQNLHYLGPQDSNYTCIGEPVFGPSPSCGAGDLSMSNQEEGLNWDRSYAGGSTQQRLENPPAMNRFQDGL